MKIFRHELKKLLLCPFLLGLLLVFAAFDIFMLLDDLSPKYSGYREIYAAIVGDESAEDGAKEYYKGFYDDFSALYDGLDMNEIFKQKMALYFPTVPEDSDYFGWAENNYAKLQTRVENIRNSDEAGGDFYPGPAYKIHRKLGGLLSRSLLESMLMTALGVLYLMDYERVNASEGLIYATKCGRGVQLKKILAGAVFSVLSSAVLFVIPLAVFSCTVPMKGLWRTSVSAFTLTEPTSFFTYPFITWLKLSVLGQLLLSLGLCEMLILITAAVCAGTYFFLRNSYFAMLGLGVAFFGAMLLPYAVPAGVWHTVSLMTPAILFDSAGMWFIEFDPARGPWFEAATAAVWAVISACAMLTGWKEFKRKGM